MTQGLIKEALQHIQEHPYRDVELLTLSRRFVWVPESVVDEAERARYEGEDRNPSRTDASFLLPPGYDRSRLATMSGAELTAMAEAGALSNTEQLTDCWLELARRRRRKPLNQLERTLEMLSVKPIPWLELAREVAQRFQRTTEGNHHLYAILLSGYPAGEYWVYIGETKRRVEVRFLQHMVGRYASRAVPRRGIQLLPSLYEHLNPLSRQEAKRIEIELAAALKGAGIRTEGGLPPSDI